MTRDGALELLHSGDLTLLGMQADEERSRHHPDGIATYCGEETDGSLEVIFLPGGDWVTQLDELRCKQAESVRLKAGPGLMAVDYLRLMALCRLYLETAHIEADVHSVGLKVSQLALRFGADDLGAVGKIQNEPNSAITEESIRRVIRDAGFVPKKRLARYGALALL